MGLVLAVLTSLSPGWRERGRAWRDLFGRTGRRERVILKWVIRDGVKWSVVRHHWCLFLWLL